MDSFGTLASVKKSYPEGGPLSMQLRLGCVCAPSLYWEVSSKDTDLPDHVSPLVLTHFPFTFILWPQHYDFDYILTDLRCLIISHADENPKKLGLGYTGNVVSADSLKGFVGLGFWLERRTWCHFKWSVILQHRGFTLRLNANFNF